MADSPILAGTGPGKLYVFFHGLITLVQMPDKFVAVVVDMGEAHSYRVGNWLTEVPLPRGFVVALKNVTPGTAGLDRTKISVLGAQSFFPSPHIYATVVLPRPALVRSVRRSEFPATVIGGAGTAALREPKSGMHALAMVNILEYDFADVAQVQLTGFPEWAPSVFSRAPNGARCATLHFYAEPEGNPGPDHQTQEFAQASRLFEGLDLSLTSTILTAPLELAEYPTQNLSTNEVLSLIERRALLEGFAEAIQEGLQGPFPGEGHGGPGQELCSPPPVQIPPE